jgi:hypothetical protein
MAKITAKAKWVENVRSIVNNQRTHSVVYARDFDFGREL